MSTPRIVVLRALGLGDLLAAVPALRALREVRPDHRIELATPRHLACLLERDRLVDEVVDTEGLRRPVTAAPRPEIAVNLHGRGPQSHWLLQQLEPSGLVAYANREAGVDGPDWAGDEHERHRWSRLVATCFSAAYRPERVELTPPATPVPTGTVVLHPGAKDPARRWPVERWVEVARSLAGEDVVVTGDPSETRAAETIADGAGLSADRVLAGRTGVEELAALVASARLVLSCDTGVAHLASAYATASVTLFGPNPPSAWGPPESGPHTSLWRPGDDPASALHRIGADEVIRAALARLDDRSAGDVS